LAKRQVQELLSAQRERLLVRERLSARERLLGHLEQWLVRRKRLLVRERLLAQRVWQYHKRS
jgi:hypothetical protein